MIPAFRLRAGTCTHLRPASASLQALAWHLSYAASQLDCPQQARHCDAWIQSLMMFLLVVVLVVFEVLLLLWVRQLASVLLLLWAARPPPGPLLR